MNRHYLYAPIILLLEVVILSTAGCVTKPPEQAVPTIYSFSASPTEINPGQWTTLEWSTSGTTSATIQPEITDVGPSGSLKLSPDKTTTYKLSATNEAGNTTASVTVTVIPVSTGKPDLVVTDIFCVACELYYKIKNQGNADAKPSKSHLYTYGYASYKRPRAVDWVDSLAAGQEITTTFPNLDLQQFSAWCRCGDIFTICVDIDNAVDESNEDNNCMTDSGL
jgi:subtilase family serine protease